MWRIWLRPRNWGIWWRWYWGERLAFRLAWWLPRRVALWAFIRVYAADGLAPGPEYDRVCRAWEAGAPVGFRAEDRRAAGAS